MKATVYYIDPNDKSDHVYLVDDLSKLPCFIEKLTKSFICFEVVFFQDDDLPF